MRVNRCMKLVELGAPAVGTCSMSDATPALAFTPYIAGEHANRLVGSAAPRSMSNLWSSSGMSRRRVVDERGGGAAAHRGYSTYRSGRNCEVRGGVWRV